MTAFVLFAVARADTWVRELPEGISVRYGPPLQAVFGTNVLDVQELALLALCPLVV